MMQYMIIIKGTTIAEEKKDVSQELRVKMDLFNDALDEAGIKTLAKGLHPTKYAIRIHFQEDGTKVFSKGPFYPYEDQIEGFFLIEVQSDEEAYYWFQQVLDPIGSGQGLIELRKVY